MTFLPSADFSRTILGVDDADLPRLLGEARRDEG